MLQSPTTELGRQRKMNASTRQLLSGSCKVSCFHTQCRREIYLDHAAHSSHLFREPRSRWLRGHSCLVYGSNQGADWLRVYRLTKLPGCEGGLIGCLCCCRTWFVGCKKEITSLAPQMQIFWSLLQSQAPVMRACVLMISA